jgi:hypothetical protein
MIAASHTRSYRLRDAWMNIDGVTKTEQLVPFASCGTDGDQARRAERALSAANEDALRDELRQHLRPLGMISSVLLVLIAIGPILLL